jgi:hypothetical protein
VEKSAQKHRDLHSSRCKKREVFLFRCDVFFRWQEEEARRERNSPVFPPSHVELAISRTIAYVLCNGALSETLTSSLSLSLVIPQTCRYKSKKYECGLSISCVLSGGKPMDLCSGGMIWSCCVDIVQHDAHEEEQSQSSSLNNASKYRLLTFYRRQRLRRHTVIQVTVSKVLISISLSLACTYMWCVSNNNHCIMMQ